ncbi:hypothetical protein J6590_074226 [Homalodisca vitripennis]|nr:hypothetical protein J6590_074226 [Homalodisca vitripennis]
MVALSLMISSAGLRWCCGRAVNKSSCDNKRLAVLDELSVISVRDCGSRNVKDGRIKLDDIECRSAVVLRLGCEQEQLRQQAIGGLRWCCGWAVNKSSCDNKRLAVLDELSVISVRDCGSRNVKDGRIKLDDIECRSAVVLRSGCGV